MELSRLVTHCYFVVILQLSSSHSLIALIIYDYMNSYNNLVLLLAIFMLLQ